MKSCSIIYTRNKHNHGMKKATNIRRKKQEKERDYVDHYGKLWPFHANIGKNISQDKLLKNFGFTCIEKHPKILYICCTKTNPAGGRCKFTGIYLKSNGCLYTRGEHEHTKRGKTPQNIGDDYLDQFGKIWKFNSEIGKNVRREIFLNKFGLGTMVTNISGFHLHCEKKGSNGRCKFVGIYLNSNGCLYTRGEHNHEHIEKDPKPNIGDDYVDFYRKKWKFHAKIGKNIPNGIWLSKFAFTAIYPKQKTVNLYCQKQATNGGKCPIKGIYVKANGCLYIRGKHEHKFN